MSERKICKACGRKRVVAALFDVGTSHNYGKVWLCCYGDKYWSGCNVENWNEIKNDPPVLGTSRSIFMSKQP